MYTRVSIYYADNEAYARWPSEPSLEMDLPAPSDVDLRIDHRMDTHYISFMGKQAHLIVKAPDARQRHEDPCGKFTDADCDPQSLHFSIWSAHVDSLFRWTNRTAYGYGHQRVYYEGFTEDSRDWERRVHTDEEEFPIGPVKWDIYLLDPEWYDLRKDPTTLTGYRLERNSNE